MAVCKVWRQSAYGTHHLKPSTALFVTDDFVQQSVCCLITGMMGRIVSGQGRAVYTPAVLLQEPYKQWLHQKRFKGYLKVSLSCCALVCASTFLLHASFGCTGAQCQMHSCCDKVPSPHIAFKDLSNDKGSSERTRHLCSSHCH